MHTEGVGNFLHGTLDRASNVASRFASSVSRIPRVVLALGMVAASSALISPRVEASTQQPPEYFLNLRPGCEGSDPVFDVDYFIQRPIGKTMVLRRSDTGEILPLFRFSPGPDIRDTRRVRFFLANQGTEFVPIAEGVEYSVWAYDGVVGLDAIDLGLAPSGRAAVMASICSRTPV